MDSRKKSTNIIYMKIWKKCYRKINNHIDVLAVLEFPLEGTDLSFVPNTECSCGGLVMFLKLGLVEDCIVKRFLTTIAGGQEFLMMFDFHRLQKD